MSAVPTMAELKEVAFRTFWTFVAGATGIPVGVEVLGLDVSLLEAQGLAGFAAAITVINAYARLKAGTVSTPNA